MKLVANSKPIAVVKLYPAEFNQIKWLLEKDILGEFNLPPCWLVFFFCYSNYYLLLFVCSCFIFIYVYLCLLLKLFFGFNLFYGFSIILNYVNVLMNLRDQENCYTANGHIRVEVIYILRNFLIYGNKTSCFHKILIHINK